MLFLYLILLISIGMNFFLVLKHFKIFDYKNCQKKEIISFIITSGLILFTLYLYIIGIIGIKYSFYIFIPIIAGFIFNLSYIVYCLIKNKIKLGWKCIKFNKKQIMPTILIFANLIFITYSIVNGLSNMLVYPDEFSVWALNAKNIFLGKRMNFFIDTGLENYPNFLPLLYSGFYLFIGKIQENSIRIFSGIFLLINLINMISIAKRKNLNINYVLIAILFISTYLNSFYHYSSSSYGDIPFMALYTAGLLYFIEWIASSSRKKELLIISIINMIGVCWCKQDGLFMFAYNIFIILFVLIFYEKLNIEKLNIKQVLLYCGLILIVPISWKIYNIVADFPTDLAFGAGSKFEIHLEYTIPLMQNITSQYFSDIPSTVLLGVVLVGMIMSFYKLKLNDKIFAIFSMCGILFNIAFLILCYICVFGGEALVAASFIRYYTRLIMIQAIIAILVIKPILNEKQYLKINEEKE